MAKQRNFLLGNGHRLTSPVAIKKGMEPKDPPYDLASAKSRQRTQQLWPSPTTDKRCLAICHRREIDTTNRRSRRRGWLCRQAKTIKPAALQFGTPQLLRLLIRWPVPSQQLLPSHRQPEVLRLWVVRSSARPPCWGWLAAAINPIGYDLPIPTDRPA